MKFILPAVLAATMAMASAASASTVVVFEEDFSNDLTNSGGISRLNFTGFDQFSVSSGTVDLIQSGTFSINCLTGGACVDLDGSTRNSGLFSAPINFLGGVVYTITASLSGNQRNNAREAVDFGITGGPTTVAVVSGTAFSDFSFSFSFARDTTTSLFFQDRGNDNVGAILDRVTVTAPAPIPLPASALLLLAGLGGLGAMRARRKSQA